jgi:hypothetical protein
MTIASSAGGRLTIEQFCLRAYQGIGLRSAQQGADDAAWQADFALARDLLDMLVNGLAVYGVQARAVTFYELTLTADTYKYTLPATALDIVDPAAYIDASQVDTSKADGETIVRLILREEWQKLGTKGSTGRPTLCYVHRELDQIQVWLWPIPDEAGTVRFQVHRKLADVNTDGNATLDLEEYWDDYLFVALQHKLARAKALPLALQADLAGEANGKLLFAKGKANQRPHPRIVLDHASGWRGRR